MDIHEYQAKEILINFNIPVPAGKMVSTPTEAFNVARSFGKPVAVKAQVQAGGRGKAGGIRIAQTPEEAKSAAQEILGMRIKGITVHKLLLEEALDIERELYLSFILDRTAATNVMMVSCQGGVDIEEIAKNSPQAILKIYLHPILGLLDYQLRKALFFLKIPPLWQKDFMHLVRRLWAAYQYHEATLAEINPLIFTKQGNLKAGDAKFNFDDNALLRHPEILEMAEIVDEDIWERRAKAEGLAYVRLEGNIGIIGNGAGLVMTTLDVVQAEKGKPANFLDLGGGANAEVMRKALGLVLSDPQVKGIFINIFGGITRCDEVAKGILQAFTAFNPQIPVVLRLAGTNVEEGLAILSKSKLTTAATMQEGAQKIVKLVKEHIKKHPFD
jgi:succinyl-CoA synthetase beta subunit